ncbi:IreB family regulatory phosphoprotein [Peptostreptococcus faecalis]|uniref:IreB family regulatory phosphoprotein n=1 Tax=Peptostreptococcus faecalis TaxID=2045015 RepID=UPI000C7B33DB|nr:IreB family regulatory phosphoprotein [Peptostreptococcus faecalis]
MVKKDDYTVKFEGLSDDKMDVAKTIRYVYDSLLEKGYNPVNQIIGYLLSGDSSYITSYNNARTMMKQFERDEILEEVITKYLNIEE